MSVKGWGQQVIGSFPYMDGGFENQSTGNLGTTLSSTAWSRQNQSGASTSIITSNPRIGSKYASVTSVSTASRNLQSPQSSTASDGPAPNTSYVVQFFVRNTAQVNSFQAGVTVNGTANPTYSTAAILSANTEWAKQTYILSTPNNALTSCGIGLPGRAQAGSFNIDDFVIYSGNSVDNTAPNPPGSVTVSNPTTSSLDISWEAASGGVDGGGYVVVRYSSNPNADNDPNQNGIYAVGNTIINGTGSLTGAVRYIGTGTSFTDNVDLSSSTQYWYKVYTVDKAFNYSVENTGTGTTQSLQPSIYIISPTLTGFSYTVGSGPSAEQSFTVSGNNLSTDITITPPTNYEISTGTGISFSATNPITLSPTNGTVSQTVVYVRLKAGLSAGAYYSETINITSTGADPKTVTCSGDVWPQIEWANLQWPPSGTISQGGNFMVYAQVYKSGVTEPAGQGTNIQAWIGFSTSNTNPNTWTNWVLASYIADVGNNDEYMANIGAAITSSGTYYYASRFKYGNADYVYGGTDGFWNGTGSISGTLNVTSAPLLNWVNLQWPGSGSITTGQEYFVYAQAYHPGVTPGAGAGAGISAWIGYSTDDTDPSTWTNWYVAPYFGEVGNNDEYRFDLGSVIIAPGTYYYASRFKLDAADYQYGGYSSGGGGFWDGTTFVSGVLAVQTPEPSNHASGFTASQTPPTTTTITLNWTDSTPAAEAYLIKGSSVGYGSITAPVDGTAESDGTLVKNVLAGVQTHTFTGLTPSTTYYFKIWPYNGTGSNINYKTDGNVPEASVQTQAPTVNTYTWIGANNASWDTPTNWNPTRTDPQNSDQLLFNDGSTKTITGVATGTIGKLTVTNSTKITLQAGTANQVLSIGNNIGHDLVVDAGSELNISGSNTLSLNVVEGATGSISGSITLSGAGHKLLANDANAITFNSGSLFVSGTGFTGNPFGTTNLNSIIFSSGSVFELIAGGNPFGASAPNSVVVFQAGSLFRLKSASAPAFSGRTYANFEYDNSGTATSSGSSALSVDNLTIKQGTFNMNMTGTPGHSIKGNIHVHSGATFTFSPVSTGTINLNGTGQQLLSGGGTITSSANATLSINNSAGIILNNNAVFAGSLQIGSGSTLTINPGRTLTVTGNLSNSGTLSLKSDATGTASQLHNTDNVPATIERYITGSTNLSSSHYHLVSVPLNSSVTAAQFLGSYLYSFNLATQQWVGLGTSLTTPMPSDQGYMIFYPNSSTTYNFVGQMNNGPFTPAIMTGANQFALVPNPYPSAIDWDAASGWTKTNINDAIWIWNPAGPNYASYSGGVGVNGGTKFIPVGQAFFVKSNASSPALSMNNNVRVHNSQAFWKSGSANGVLRVKSAGNGRLDEIALRMRTESAAGFDNVDVDKLFGADIVPQIYFVVENKDIAINSIPPDALPISIPVAFKMNTSGQASLHFEGLESFESEVQFLFEDLLTGSIINLREISSYSFSHQPSNNAQRFVLHLTSITGNPAMGDGEGFRAWFDGRDICLSLPGAQQGVTIEVFDALGRSLALGRRDAAPILRIPAPSAGVLLLRATTGNKVYSFKVITR